MFVGTVWLRSRPEGSTAIVAAVLTLPLTIGGGMLARHGCADVSFSYGSGTSGLSPKQQPERAFAAAGLQDDDEADKFEDASSGGAVGSGVQEDRTIWVGGLPAAVTRSSSDELGGPVSETAVAKLFAGFGRVVGVTARWKEGGGAHRSWALITFEEPATAAEASAYPGVVHQHH